MASTNKTTHYELPQWIGSDKPTFLGDLNQAFEDIDTGIYNAATAASNAASAAGSAQSAASTAQSAAESAASTASAANTLATTANTNAVSALNSIGSTPLQTTAQTLTAAVNEVLHDVPDDATDIPYDNQTSGLTATNVQAAIDEIAQGGGGGGGSTVIATSTANTTYGAQATELAAAYDTLTDDQKLHSILQFGSEIFLYYGNGQYTRVASTGSTFTSYTFSLISKKVFQTIISSTPAHSEITSNTNSDTISLVVLG